MYLKIKRRSMQKISVTFTIKMRIFMEEVSIPFTTK
jgi:hypothetical protein